MRVFALALAALLAMNCESYGQIFGRRGQPVPAVPSQAYYPAQTGTAESPVALAQAPVPMAMPAAAAGSSAQPAPCDGCPPPPAGCPNCYPPYPQVIGSCGYTNLRPSQYPNPFPTGNNSGPFPTVTVPGPQTMYSGYFCYSTPIIVPACTSTTALVPNCKTIVINYSCCPGAAAAGGAAAATCQVTACVYDTPLIADINTCGTCTRNSKIQVRIRRCDPNIVDIVATDVPGMPTNWIIAFGITRTAASAAPFNANFGSITPLGPNDNPPPTCP